VQNERENKAALKIKVGAYYDYQKMRVSLGNRLKMKKNGDGQIIPEDQQDGWVLSDRDRKLFTRLYETTISQEGLLEKAIREDLRELAIWTDYLSEIKGVGPMMAAVIVSEYDIEIAATVSKMWAFTGLAPGRDRLKKGEKAHFNKWLRTKMIGVLGSSFLRSNSPYREYYDEMKTRLENEEGWKDETKLHQHRAAVRYMIKMFLKDLYVAWRTIEGLPVREPYQKEYLGHGQAVRGTHG